MAPKKGGGPKANATNKQIPQDTEGDWIVFGDGKRNKTKNKKNDIGDASKDSSQEPARPTVKQIIGGASWTGKLPVNLLSEHCQKVKWNKPDYDMRTMPGRDGSEKMYRSAVTLSKTDPKTRERVTLPPIRLPPEHVQLSDQPSVLEARHFAATYALFRIASMKNIHMTLPPNYRDLWKGEFSDFKKHDVAEGRGWKYEDDPFAAEVKRQEIHDNINKRKQNQEKLKTANADSTTSTAGAQGASKLWNNAPKIDMGLHTRSKIEQVVKRNMIWNPYRIRMSQQVHDSVLQDVTALGFRPSHIREALEVCKDQEEVLEWLMIHVPEDDLPKWALPPSYSAGVVLATADLAKEAKLKRLARAGYAIDLCLQQLRQCRDDELTAAITLQRDLVPKLYEDQEDGFSLDTTAWEEELLTLEAIYGEKFVLSGKQECSIFSESASGAQFTVHVKCPPGYPSAQLPVIAIEAKTLPAYIRLSALKQVLAFAQASLMGEPMVFNICQWLETELPSIIENPGKLSDLNTYAQTKPAQPLENAKGKEKASATFVTRSRSARRHGQDRRSNDEILASWRLRQDDQAQIKMMTARQKLPAWQMRDEIVGAIQNHQVTIVSGETGSGKSTQAVQFILDHAITNLKTPAATNIICTQPRRVAALSLADRVSSERCSRVGDEVGYSIRGESRISEKTKITFMTTGVLLRRLQNSGSIGLGLEGISHIFIDEVHERSLDTDFLLSLLRDLLKKHPRLKLVLMSATLDADIFISYFGGASKVGMVHIEGRTFPVTDLFLDDVLLSTGFVAMEDEEDTGKAIRSLGIGINYQLIRELVDNIHNTLEDPNGSILIFLPGTMEIDRCLKAIRPLRGIHALPLHASLLPAEQRKVFPPAPVGQRKVIASTNVAETSITIEDVVAVIDTGRVKETNYDHARNVVKLEEIWASQAACKQRRGRAGRVRAGICYKLFTKNIEATMAAKSLPEIQRVPLEQLCLSVKAMDADRDVAVFLSQTITPPNSSAVLNAIRNLHLMGAMEDDRLTALGQYLALIPADLRCAKLLVYGTLFGCLETCLSVASILTVRSPFVSPTDKRDQASEARESFPTTHGDILLAVSAFDEWSELSSRSKPREINEWCSTKFLSSQTMRDIASTRRQLLDALKDAGLVPFTYGTISTLNSIAANDATNSLLLRALIAASLQPQIALIQLPSKKYISSISGAKELDPEARTIKFFIPGEADGENSSTSPGSQSLGNRTLPVSSGKANMILSTVERTSQLLPMTRVFIHPSSVLFTMQTFSHHATHLSYFTKLQTSKLFIRDLTPLNVYSLLLFGGKLEVDTSGVGLIVGGVWKVRGWARIGVLISRLRVLLDQELHAAIEGESHGADADYSLMGRMKDSKIIVLVKRLIELNGQDV